MKKLFEFDLYKLSAAIAFGVFSLNYSPAASAIAIYDAHSSLSLTLSDVSTLNGQGSLNNNQKANWSIEVEGFDYGGPILYQFGDAEAYGSTSVVAPAAMGIGDTITQTSSSNGSATNGFSWTDALTDLDLDIFVKNFSGRELRFTFDYSITSTAKATGENALAYSGVGLWDDFDLDIIAEVEAELTELDASQFGTFDFILQSYDVNGQCGGQGAGCQYTISAFVDTYGEAEAFVTVPEPSVLMLFGIGLPALLSVARNRKS